MKSYLENMPAVGSIVLTPEGKGTVMETFTLLQMVKVRVKLEDDTEELVNYKVDEIILTDEKDPHYEVKKRKI